VATGFTHSHPRGRRRIPTDNKVHWAGAHPLYGASCQQGLLDPIKPAQNQSAGWLAPLTDNGSACRKSWSQYYSYSSYIIIACKLGGFYAAGLSLHNRGRRTDNPSGRHPIRSIGAPHLHHPPFLRQMPFQFLPQPSQFIMALDRHRFRIMLACIPGGLVARPLRCVLLGRVTEPCALVLQMRPAYWPIPAVCGGHIAKPS